MAIKFREERVEDKLIFYLEGELVAKEKVVVLSSILEALDREKDVSCLVLELSKVGYLDSSGLGLLLELKDRMAKRGGRLVLVGLSDYAKRLLSLTHLDKAFEIYEALDDLLTSSQDEGAVQEGKIEIPSDLEYVQDVSRRIISVLQRFHLSESILMDLRLAVEEVVVNAIRHGNQFSSDKFVLIEYVADPRQIEIKVRDEGEGFDFETTEGKGLRLVKSIMDEVSFSRGGSQVTMKKRFR